GIIEGLKLAWNLGIKKLRVQTDSRTTLSLLCNEGHVDHQHSSLVLNFRELGSRFWDLQLSHVYHEANYAADYLAYLGHYWSRLSFVFRTKRSYYRLIEI
ncbi:hypothetical protein LINPERPRIM_LOCUS26615, partial [Linum perenne]